MTAAQQIPQPTPPTPKQKFDWIRLINFVDGPLTLHCQKMIAASEAAANIQLFMDAHTIPHLVYSESHYKITQQILDNYNTLKRILNGVDIGQYYITDKGDDITIWAPHSMNREAYQDDIYPGFGGFWIPVIIGIVLIGATYITVESLDYSAKSDHKNLIEGMIESAKKMSQKPADVRAAYDRMLKNNASIINKAESGLLDDLLGAGAGKKIAGGLGIVAAGVGIVLALSLIPKRGK